MRKFRVALYFLGIEAETPAEAIEAAQGSEPNHAWAAPPEKRGPKVGDPLMAEAYYLLQEWSVRCAGREPDLSENSKTVAEAIKDRFPAP